MSQSELEANTCNRREARENACEQARENACEQVTIISFGFASNWLRKWGMFFSQSQSIVMQNCKTKVNEN